MPDQPGSERRPTQFGFYLLGRMAEAGYARQIDLVKATGVSAATISRLIYSGEFTPDVRTLQRLGDALNVPATELVARRLQTNETPLAVGVSQVEPSFVLDPELADEVQITDQARRLSWLVTSGVIPPEAARRLSVLVESAMDLVVPHPLLRSTLRAVSDHVDAGVSSAE